MNFAVPYRSRLRVRDLAIALDRDGEPIAETWRRVSQSAAKLELPRPSYTHVRRVVLDERVRRKAIADAVQEAASTIAAGRAPDFDYTMRRLHEAGVLE